MLVTEIINTKIPSLTLTDTVSSASIKYDLSGLNKLVVVDEHSLVVGVLNRSSFVEVENLDLTIANFPLEPVIPIIESKHVFETARLMFANDMNSLPVVDHKQKYKGMVIKGDVVSALSSMFNLIATGSVLTIEFAERDYSLSDIVRIIEIEGGKILGIAVQQPDSQNNNYRASVKLNLQDSSVVSAALRRYGYLITSEENSELLEYDFSERADELIRYLDL